MTTLVVLAAGMGSRYGGLKQIDPVGPAGETIIDYSVFDAARAGFRRAVFVIRRDFEAPFREKLLSRFERVMECVPVYQELSTCTEGYPVPAERKKPWGTGQALLAAEEAVEGPFAVINADDFYGAGSFRAMAGFLADPAAAREGDYAMVGFVLRNTLSDHGHVSRGVCEIDEAFFLRRIVERTRIFKGEGGKAWWEDEGGERRPLTGDEIASMNLWGFRPSIFDHLRERFRRFLERHGGDPKAEFFIPTVVNELVEAGAARVKVLPTRERWFGVTYREDRDAARAALQRLVKEGRYPERLWK